MDFEYKKYSLENLEKWMSDALLSSEATPQEIYDIIRKVVEEEYHYFKHHTGRCYELLALLNGNGKGHLSCDKDDPSEECKNAWTSFWEENYYPEEVKDAGMRPWGHSDLEYMIANPTLTEDRISNFPGEQYSEEELNAMCDAADDKEKCREYNIREAEYYNQRAKLDAEVAAIKSAGGYEWTPDPQVSRNDETRLKCEDGWVYESPDGGKTVTKRKPGSLEKIPVKTDGYSTSKTTKRWVLPVEESYIDGTNEYYVSFPDDLLAAANLKEGDDIEWQEQEDGSCLMKKVSNEDEIDLPEWIVEYEETIVNGKPESVLIIPDDIRDILGDCGGTLKWILNKTGTFTIQKLIGEN